MCLTPRAFPRVARFSVSLRGDGTRRRPSAASFSPVQPLQHSLTRAGFAAWIFSRCSGAFRKRVRSAALHSARFFLYFRFSCQNSFRVANLRRPATFDKARWAKRQPSRALSFRLRTKASVGRPAFFSFVLLLVLARLHVWMSRLSAQAKALGAQLQNSFC